MARANGTTDSFFLLPEYAVDIVYMSLVIVRWATMERYILGGIGGASPIKNKNGSAAVDIMPRIKICAGEEVDKSRRRRI